MELFKIFGKIGINNDDANSKLDGTARKAQQTSERMRAAFTNIRGAVERNFNPTGVQNFGRQIQAVSGRVESVGMTLTRRLTVPIVGATAAAGGLVAALGWRRLVSIDTAQGQLRGLGYTTEDVERITENLVEALEGGMLTMGEATSAAAAGMAAGVEEGAELTRYIQLLDAAVAGGNGTFDEMNQIFARIQGSGRLMTNELNMIEQRMPGFAAAGADAFGVSQEAFREMVTNGEVSADDFLNIMDDFGGDMAREYAKTWEGMVQNTRAFIAIIGEQLLGGVFEQSKESIADFIEYLRSDEVAEWAERTGEKITEFFNRAVDAVQDGIDKWRELDDEAKKFALTVVGVIAAAGPVLVILARIGSAIGALVVGFGKAWAVIDRVRAVFGLSAIGGGQLLGILARFLGPLGLIASAFMLLWQNSETFREGIRQIGSHIVEQFQPIFERISDEVIPKFTEAFSTVSEALNPVVEFLTNVFAATFQFIFPFVLELVQSVISNIAGVINGLVSIISGVIDVIAGIFSGDWARVWEGLKQIVSGAVEFIWNAIQLYFIGRFIGILRSFGSLMLNLMRGAWTGLVSLIRSSLTGARNLVQNIFNGIRSFLNSIMNGISSFFGAVWNGILAIIRGVLNGIRSLVSSIFNGIRNTISSVLNGVRSVVSAVWNSIRATISAVLNGIRSVVVSVFNGIRNTISSVVNSVRSFISSGFNAARSLVTSAVNGMRSAVTSAFSSIMSTIRGIPGRIRGVFSGAANLLRNAGRNIIQGLIGGITSMISNVKDAASNVMGAIRNFLPFSPAKEGPFSGKGWTLYSGQAITESLGEGMEDEEGSVLHKARKIMGALKSELDPTITAHSDVTAGASTVMHSINQGRSEPNPLEEKVDAMVEILRALLEKDSDIILDGDTLVGALGGKINNELGNISSKNRRGAR